MDKNENYVGVSAFGASVGLQVSGLDKPIRTVGRGIGRLFGFTRRNVHRAAVKVAMSTQPKE